MKIAEALVKIKDLKGKFSELHRTVQNESTYEVIEEMVEASNMEEKITELVSVSQEIARLKSCIAVTNAHHGLSAKIHEMEHLRSCVAKLEYMTSIKQSHFEYRRIDYEGPAVKLETRATFSVEDLTETVDGFRSKVREIDLELQRRNWEIDLIES